MLEQSIPASRAAEAARLAKQIEEFQRRGGQVEATPIRVGDPQKPAPNTWRQYPATKETPGISAAQKLYIQQCEDARKKITPQVIEMSAQGIKVEVMAKLLKVSPGVILRIRSEEGIVRKRKPRINTIKELADKHCKA